MPPTFTRGRWAKWGTGNFTSACWRVAEAGAGGVAPYDKLLTTAGTLVDLSPTHNGQSLGGARGQGDNMLAAFQLWDTAVYDSVRSRMILTLWGGDQGNSSNEVNEWDFASGTWNPNGRPMHPTTRLHVANGTNWPAAYIPYNGPASAGGPAGVVDLSGAYPNNVVASSFNGLATYPLGRHTYGGMTFMPTVQKVWTFGGFPDWSPNGSCFLTAEWNTVTKKWQIIDGGDGSAFGGGALHGTHATISSCWDSVANRVLFTTGDGLFAYDPSGPVNGRTTWLRNDNALINSLGNAHMVFDPVRNHAFLLGAPDSTTFIEFDFSGGHTNSPVKTSKAIGGTPWPTTSGSTGFGFGPGALFDPVADRYIVWVGTTTLYSVHPTTYVSTPITASSGGADPGIPIGGIWSRFWYIPSADVYATINDATNEGAFVFAPVRIAAPVLACSDLTSGPRTGNPDTAFGQTANANGAYVTLFGFNLGDVTDVVTATVGGVNALVVDRGQAIAPRCPANLYNQHLKVQCMTIQVPAGAPLGAQVIDVVVNGQSSISFDLPFTVTNTGTIRLSTASGGALIALLAGMTSGDITYLQTGAALTSGWVMGSNTNGSNSQMAIGAYPGATVQFGDSSHDAVAQGASGSGRNLTMFKLVMRGNNLVGAGAVKLIDNSRYVGCNLQTPGAFGSAGAFNTNGGNVAILANEFANCGGGTDGGQYHTVYVSGLRDNPTPPPIESGYEIAYNYFHDNLAARAINCFNRNHDAFTGVYDAPIGDFHIHHNLIVNQTWAGIGLLNGVVGTNRVHDNLLINCGQNTDPSGAHACAMELHPTSTINYPALGTPITVEISNNTIINAGSLSTPGQGAYEFRNFTFDPGWALTFKNNITYQANGIQYVTTLGAETPTTDPTHKSNNLWFGAGAPPSFDSVTVNADPQFVSTTAPLNYRLQTTSPAIGAGVVLSTTSTDLDGSHRATSGVWDQGAYTFTGVTTVTAPILTSLVPSTCLPGAASFTLTIFASPTQGFTTGATIFWDGALRTTTFVNSQQVTITVPAADVAMAGAHLVTATNPGSAVSNFLQFNVSLGAASLTLVWNGLAADRVSPASNGLASDGALDGTVTATLHASGGRTITALSMQATNPSNTNIGTWNTLNSGGIFVLGAALTIGGAYLNNAVTMAVNFTVADNGSFVVFGSDFPTVNGIEFVPGNTLTLTVTFSDGEIATGSVLITQSNPVIASLSPPSQPVGSPSFVLTVFGTGFQNGAVIKWNGAARTTTFVSSTTVQMTVLVSDVAALGTATVTVTNPDLVASNTATFSIVPVVQTGTFVSSVM